MIQQSKNSTLKKVIIFGVLFIVALMMYLFAPREELTDKVPSIAFLYLKNLSSEQDEPFCYGITEDLIIDVAKAGRVRIATMNDVLNLPKENITTEKIAKKLHVRYVMEGSFKREGNIFRIAVNIMDSKNNASLWSDKIETTTNDASSLQGKLTKSIIAALHLTPTAIVENEITKARTPNPDAYERYLRAKYLFGKKKTKDDVLAVRNLFQQATNIDSMFVSAWLGIGLTFELQGEYEEAKKIIERALSIAQGSKDNIEEGNCLRELGIVHSDIGDQKKAFDFYNKSLDIMKELGDKKGEGNALNSLGSIYISQGNTAKALENYSMSLTISEELGEEKDQAITLSNIGIVYGNQGDFSKTTEYFSKSLNIEKELEDKQGEAITENNIGYAYKNQGEYSKAIEYYTMSLKIVQDLGDKHTEESILNDLGLIYGEQGDHNKGMEYCAKSIDISRTIGNKSMEGYNLLSYGKLLYQVKEYNASLDSLKNSIIVLKQVQDKDNLMWAYSFLTLLEAVMKKSGEAEIDISSLEDMFKEIQKPENFIEICWNLSEAYSELGNTAKAKEYLDKAYNEVILRSEKISDNAMKQSFLTNVKLNREVVAVWKKK